MSCNVKLFEPNSASPPVHETLKAAVIELLAVNEATKANLSSLETNKALNASATSHGADLQFNKDSIVYQVAISDPTGVYGGTTITSLTGTTDGDLDVVLEKVPQTRSTSAGGAGSAAQARQAVLNDLSWTAGEKQAVLSLMNAVGSLRGASTPLVVQFLRRFEVALENLGIDYTLF
jgi:hypothetical protein